MKDNKELKNKVLEFKQPADFFIKKAEKHMDAGNFLEALHLYRKVLCTDPDNVEYLLSIAQIYSEMGLYAESNDVLLKIAKYGNTPTECLFALGCNYMGMQNYALADEAFEQYLSIDPEGEFAEDIDDLFEMLDEDDEGVLQDVNREMLLDEAFTGKQHLDSGDYRKAIHHLENVVKKDNLMYPAMNNLALSYFFDGQKSRAIELSKKVLDAEPRNLHACCNLAFFYSEMGQRAIAENYISSVESVTDIDPDDMHKLALTYCELGMHEKAYKWFAKIVSYQPYDVKILHFCGLSAYNCGCFSESAEYFMKIMKIDPNNSLAVYYRKKAEDSKKTGTDKKFEYVYQVQFDEIKLRVKYLNECLKQKRIGLSEKWKSDEYFRSIINWGLYFGDEYIKRIVIEIMCMFSEKDVEDEFRNFLLRSTEGDEIKNDVFMCLKRIGAKEPYVAYIKGAIVEVRVGSIPDEIKNLPKPYTDTLNCFLGGARGEYDEEFISSGIAMLVSVAKAHEGNGDWISRPQALAAAMELRLCEEKGIAIPKKTGLVLRYGTTIGTLNKYYDIIKSEPDSKNDI